MKFHSTAIMLLASSSTCLAFVSSPPSFLRHVAAPRHFLPPSAEVLGIRHRRHAPSLTSLSMSTASPTADPSKFFTEDAYTEAAFSSILQLTTVAESYGSQSVEPSMLAEVLLNPSKFGGGGEGPSGAARDVTEKILNAAGVDLPRLRRDLDAHMAKIPRASESSNKNMSRTLSRVLGEAQSVQRTLGDSYVSVEALVLALAKEDRDFCVPALKKQEVKYDAVLAAVQKHRSDVGPADSRGSESTYDALMKYGRDLTQAAREGKLDPVIGRDEETRRAIQILSRRSKNNPILLGDPGTGKTAVAEGIAQRMVAGDVPDGLQAPCKLVALDMGALIAGAKMRGEFEERLRAVLEEVTKSDGEIVLFIDEIHTVVGAGAAGGAMDASNLLKPALARGELRCIGATTMNEYRQYVEKDKALERRFQQVIVDQPSPEDTVSILRGLKPRYELHHGVRIRDEALLAAAKLSHRYIPDRFLPDKAIDLVDEACAKLKNELTSKPTALDEVDRKVIQLEMEKLSLESDYGDMEYDDTKSTGRLRTIIDQLADLRKTQSALTARWMAERGGVDQITELKQRIDQVQLDIENAERDYELNKAAELKYSVLPELASQLQALEMDREVAAGEDGAVRDEEATSDRLLRDEVVAEDISEVVASWTGIPAEKMMSSERDRILSMDKKLAERVIGQDEAIQNVVDAILRSRAGLNDPSKPISSQIFLGPTGVGKTELCKALSEFMFDTEEAIIRIDMSEYMEKHTVSRLVGAPPGYVGVSHLLHALLFFHHCFYLSPALNVFSSHPEK
uniref:Clp R domain-containing protein n=1 Tax=Corethron hystrix TaxID=216773 RepID=A0A7S1B777_9STRA|mmetsp:Transcript_15619/g.35151  ORF Transcript_15619/g.35151 Transcript_15619/m.35151 type:complete len:794 (+) Transcript_15619:233-2614(+)